MEEKCFICNENVEMKDLAEPVYLAGQQGAFMFFICDKCFKQRNIPMMKRNQMPLKELNIADGVVSVVTHQGKKLSMSYKQFLDSLRGA